MDLNRFTLNGLIMVAGGLLVLLVQGISSAMEKPEWTSMLLGDFGYDMWIAISDKMPMQAIQNGFDYLVFELPLWMLLMSAGALCIIIGMFIKK